MTCCHFIYCDTIMNAFIITITTTTADTFLPENLNLYNVIFIFHFFLSGEMEKDGFKLTSLCCKWDGKLNDLLRWGPQVEWGRWIMFWVWKWVWSADMCAYDLIFFRMRKLMKIFFIIKPLTFFFCWNLITNLEVLNHSITYFCINFSYPTFKGHIKWSEQRKVL